MSGSADTSHNSQGETLQHLDAQVKTLLFQKFEVLQREKYFKQ